MSNTLQPTALTLRPGVVRLGFGTPAVAPATEPATDAVAGPIAGPIRLLDFSGVAPDDHPVGRLPAAAIPVLPGGDVGDVAAGDRAITVYQTPGYTVARIPIEPDERLYGFGLQFERLNHRGRMFELRVDHYKGRDDGRTHAPVPLCVSSRGYALFVNVATRITVYAGRTHDRHHHPPLRDRRNADWQPVAPSAFFEIAVPHAGIELLLFAGPTPLDAVRRFNRYCGGGCLPPKWGLGFWHRVPLAYDAAAVEREVEEFAAHEFPLSVVGLEPGWHSASYPTTCEWHPTAFADPQAFLQRLLHRGVRVNLWENAFLHPDSPLGRELAEASSSHTGSWGGLCPDLSRADVRTQIADHHETTHLAAGVAGYKLDECDDDNWLFPDYAHFASGIPATALHQVYGLLFQRATYDLFRRRDQRTYGLVRASNAGGVSYPYVLYNDCYDHREYIRGLCNAGVSGLLFTPEARSAVSAEDWLRRCQSTCFSPLAQLNAWTDGTKPWDFPTVAAAVRRAVLLRGRLIPYLYTAFTDYRERGVPPFRPMFMHAVPPRWVEWWLSHQSTATTETNFAGNGGLATAAGGAAGGSATAAAAAESDSGLAAVCDQYMIGPDLLAAPLFAGEPERSVVLPPGRWFDFYSGVCVGEGTICVPATTEDHPLFVRDGGIIAMFADDYLQVPAGGTKTPIEVRYYGQAAGSVYVYDDDGATFAYERDAAAACWWRLSCTDGRSPSVEGPRGAWESGYGPFRWRVMTADHA